LRKRFSNALEKWAVEIRFTARHVEKTFFLMQRDLRSRRLARGFDCAPQNDFFSVEGRQSHAAGRRQPPIFTVRAIVRARALILIGDGDDHILVTISSA
jgi:hypothetical protein